MKITTFPDGQKLATREFNDEEADYIALRLSSWEDFQDMLVQAAAYRRSGSKGVVLYAPYILGSRSDRVFEDGGINYVKDVLAPLINAQGFSSVKTLDPHSNALELCIDNLVSERPFTLINDAIVDITKGYEVGISIISPDFGAYKRTWELVEWLNDLTGGTLDIDFVSCEKVRGLDGTILRTKVSHTPKFRHAIIVDDICDGGRTFIEISKALAGFDGKLYLWVTHGIFSKGFDELSKHFERIYCTNSVKDIQHEQLTQYPVI